MVLLSEGAHFLVQKVVVVNLSDHEEDNGSGYDKVDSASGFPS